MKGIFRKLLNILLTLHHPHCRFTAASQIPTPTDALHSLWHSSKNEIFFSADQQGKAQSSKACPCHWATCEPLSAPFGSAGACQFYRDGLVSSIGAARVCGRSGALLCAALIFSADQKEKLTLAKHVHVIGQLVSHSWPLLGQLVHVYGGNSTP